MDAETALALLAAVISIVALIMSFIWASHRTIIEHINESSKKQDTDINRVHDHIIASEGRTEARTVEAGKTYL